VLKQLLFAWHTGQPNKHPAMTNQHY